MYNSIANSLIMSWDICKCSYNWYSYSWKS